MLEENFFFLDTETGKIYEIERCEESELLIQGKDIMQKELLATKKEQEEMKAKIRKEQEQRRGKAFTNEEWERFFELTLRYVKKQKVATKPTRNFSNPELAAEYRGFNVYVETCDQRFSTKIVLKKDGFWIRDESITFIYKETAIEHGKSLIDNYWDEE